MDDRITEIRQRCENATEGPCKVIEKGNTVISYSVVSVAFEGKPQETICSNMSTKNGNAEFVANAFDDIPFLLTEIDRLTKERDAAVKDLCEMKNCDNCAKGEEPCELSKCEYEWRGVE